MKTFFTYTGIQLIDFLQVAASFVLTMSFLFGEQSGRRFWLNFMHVVFAIQCLLLILFSETLAPGFFAALMLLSTIIIRTVIARRNVERLSEKALN